MEKKKGAVGTVGLMVAITFAGKLLGLVRDRMLTVNYGSGMEANAFLTASRIPRVFFDTVFSSAIGACLIPVMGEVMAKRGKKDAMRFAGNFMTAMCVLCALMTALGTVFAGPLTWLFADGYDEATAALCTSLTRIMMPMVLFAGVAYSFVGILQSLDEFNVPAAISLISNVFIIAYYFTLNRRFGIYGLAVAFLISWVIQALVQVPSLVKKGFRFYPSLSLRNPEMRKVGKLLLPVMVSTWVLPINQTINSRFGSRLFGGAGVAAIEYAFNLYTVIAGIFVIQLANYIFPRLSRENASGGPEKMRETLRSALGITLFVVIPMTAGLFVMARPVVAFIYGGGRFDDFSIGITSRALRYMSLGMVGYAAQFVLSRAYFAGQSGVIPLLSGVVSIAANILLSMLLAPRLDVAGIAIASAVAFTLSALVLAVPMKKRNMGFFDRAFFVNFAKQLLSAGLMAGAAYGTLRAVDGRAGKLLTLLLPVAVGAAVYGVLAVLLRTDEARGAVRLIKDKLGRGESQ